MKPPRGNGSGGVGDGEAVALLSVHDDDGDMDEADAIRTPAAFDVDSREDSDDARCASSLSHTVSDSARVPFAPVSSSGPNTCAGDSSSRSARHDRLDADSSLITPMDGVPSSLPVNVKHKSITDDYEDLPLPPPSRFNPLARAEPCFAWFEKPALREKFGIILRVAAVLCIAAYLIAAMAHDARRASPVFCIVVVYMLYRLLHRWRPSNAFFTRIALCLCESTSRITASASRSSVAKGIALILCLVCVGLFVGLFVARDLNRVASFVGLIVFVLIAYALSVERRAVQWGTVAWGFSLQFVFAVAILRTHPGYALFRRIGDWVTDFLDSSDAGAQLVFGDNYREFYFAFKVLPTIIFFSAFISIMYNAGIVQVVVSKIASAMVVTMGTSGAESLSCAGNIFVGQTEAPLLIRPYIATMTLSELHAVMTGGFATIAGGVMATYISFGIPASHLIAASVMSAPAALAISKIMYPETKVSPTSGASMHASPSGTTETNNDMNSGQGRACSISDETELSPPEDRANNGLGARDDAVSDVEAVATARELGDAGKAATDQGSTPPQPAPSLGDSPPMGLIEAAAAGASEGITLVANVAAMLIAFMGLLSVCNKVLAYLGSLVGISHLSFELISSYAFVPFAWLMGVPGSDCRDVAVLLGKKTFLNEFIAYVDLKVLIENAAKMTAGDVPMGSLPSISERSVIIATYALCGFSNIGSIGIQIGGIGAMAPQRRGDLAHIAVRAMVAGTLACFMTANVAGMLL